MARSACQSRVAPRAVPLADEAAKALEGVHAWSKWKADDDLVFAHPVTGGVLAKSNISRRMHVALKAAGLDEAHRFHDLRHTFGTRAAAAGVPMRTLQEWMGHADHTTTLIYADYSPGGYETEMIERAFERRKSQVPHDRMRRDFLPSGQCMLSAWTVSPPRMVFAAGLVDVFVVA